MAGENSTEQGELDPRILTAADLFLAAVALAVALALAYFATDWDSRIGGAGSVLLYYVAPAALLLLLAGSLRAPPAQRVSMALLLFGTLVSLYAAEAALQAMQSTGTSFEAHAAVDSACPDRWRNRPVCVAAARAGVPFDSRSALQVIRDLERDGIEAWPSQAPFGDAMGARSADAHLVREGRSLEADGRPMLPLRPGVAAVRTVFCNEGGDWITYEADEHGFNNPAGLHAVGGVSIAVVGDSFGQGACVPAEANAAGVLRSTVPETLNLGLLGAGPLAGLGIVREYAAPLKPELVVWMFYEGNDLTDLDRERGHPVLMSYLDPAFTQGLRDKRSEVDATVREWIRELRRTAEEQERIRRGSTERPPSHPLTPWAKLRELRARVRAVLQPRSTPDHPFDASLFSRVSTRFRDDVDAWGGQLLFVYLPAYERFAHPYLANPHRQRVLDTVEGLGIPVLDLTPAFAADGEPLSFFHFRVKSHYTAAGYAIVAEEILLRLAELESADGRKGRVELSPGP